MAEHRLKGVQFSVIRFRVFIGPTFDFGGLDFFLYLIVIFGILGFQVF